MTPATKFLKENFEMVITLVIISAAIAFMLSQGVRFTIVTGTIIGIFAILGVGLNLVIGYTGLLSVAHIGFFGIGAYIIAILTTNPNIEPPKSIDVIPSIGLSWFVALPVAIILTGIVALLAGFVLNRFRDDIFTLTSFGFAVIALGVFRNWLPVTRGPFGIREIAKPSIGIWEFNEPWEYLVIVGFFLAVVLAICWLIVNSSFGRVLTAIREDEQAIEVFGYKATYYKLAVWVISAMIAALAGALLAGLIEFIEPPSFTLLDSILIVSIVIIGGLASLWGSVLGATVFVLLEEGMRFVPGLPVGIEGQARWAFLGLLLIVLMLFRPQGLVGRYKL